MKANLPPWRFSHLILDVYKSFFRWNTLTDTLTRILTLEKRDFRNQYQEYKCREMAVAGLYPDVRARFGCSEYPAPPHSSHTNGMAAREQRERTSKSRGFHEKKIRVGFTDVGITEAYHRCCVNPFTLFPPMCISLIRDGDLSLVVQILSLYGKWRFRRIPIRNCKSVSINTRLVQGKAYNK